MTRNFRCRALPLVALIGAMTTHAAVAFAAEPTPPVAGQQADVTASEPAPLAPPPGMSIMTAPPRTMPPQVDGQVPGCPAGKLKPLDLLV